MSKSLDEIQAEFIALYKPIMSHLYTVRPILDKDLVEKLSSSYDSLSRFHDFTSSEVIRRLFASLLSEEGKPFDGDKLRLAKVADVRDIWPECLTGYSRQFDRRMLLDGMLDSMSYREDGNVFIDSDVSSTPDDVRFDDHLSKVEAAVPPEKMFIKAKGEPTTTPRICYWKDNEFVLEDTKEQYPYDDAKVVSRIPYYGVELEVIRRKTAPSDVKAQIEKDLDGHVFIKRDGSVRANGFNNAGFEIVSVPATFRAHKELWQKFFSEKGSARFLRSWSTGVCGIHIHISRIAFTPPHLARFIAFINSTKTRKFVEDVAGRSGNSYCKYTGDWTFARVFKDLKGRDSEKYRAVNLMHEQTVEVRIFKGNVRKAGFFKCLEFVDAVFNYTKTCSYRNVSVDGFLEWMNINNYGYGNLVKWLMVKGYIQTNSTKLEWRTECA